MGGFFQTTKGGNKLHKAAHTTSISSASGTRFMGKVFCNMVYHLIRLMALSTWIWALAILFVSITSLCDCCSRPDPGGGIKRLACRTKSSSSMVKTLLAKITSFGSSRFRKPEFLVRCWSDVLPPHALDRNVIVPLGDIPTRNFIVLCFL